MVNDSKRRNYINNSKNSKNKSMSVVMEDSIIKDIKGWELSNESEKIVFRLFVGAATKNMESLPGKGSNTEFFWSVFSRIYSVNVRIQSKYGKIRTRKNSVFGYFSRSEPYIQSTIECAPSNVMLH